MNTSVDDGNWEEYHTSSNHRDIISIILQEVFGEKIGRLLRFSFCFVFSNAFWAETQTVQLATERSHWQGKFVSYNTAKACYNGTLGPGIWYRYREITLI
jgi:hypothetical protein